MSGDLTAVLLPAGQLSSERIRALLERLRPDGVLLRLVSLASLNQVQLEVSELRSGLPCEDPELVAALSEGGRASFVHVNHEAGQAVIHPFAQGEPVEGFVGEPGEGFEARLRAAIGVGLEALLAADDGSRLGIGVAASNTIGLVRGRVVRIPQGMPTLLDSFHFHDAADAVEAGEERLAWFAYDPEAVARAYLGPARALAERLGAAPAGTFGPLEGARGETVAALEALGEDSLGALAPGSETERRTLELCALEAAVGFAGGDRAQFWDERVLPMFALSREEPVISAEELGELEAAESVLHAMVEVLPYAAPPGGEGSLLTSIADSELSPLSPRERTAAGELRAAIFRLDPARLASQVRALGGQALFELADRFERAWFRATQDGPAEDAAFEAFRRARAEAGARDLDRVLRACAELAITLELQAANGLALGLLFYG